MSEAERERPQQEFMYEMEAWVSRGVRSGTWRVWLLYGDMIRMGSTVKGSEVYWENMVTRMLFTISALVSSVAVMSIKTLRVLRLILEWLELIIGGMEQTVRFASRMTG